MGIRKDVKKPVSGREEEKDFVIDLTGVEILPNTEKMVYAPLGIRSPGDIMGAKLETLVAGYERGAYMDTFLEIRKFILVNRTACLGFIKLSIASHIRWWIDNGRLPPEGDKKRMRAAFVEASKANTLSESYFTFATDVVKEIHGELDEDKLLEKVFLYTGEESHKVVSESGYSGTYGDGWYPALSLKDLTRLPNSGKVFYAPLELASPRTDDMQKFEELLDDFKRANYETVLEGITRILTEDRIVASCMVRLCVASQACIWYDVDARVPAFSLNDIEMVYGMLSTETTYREYLTKVLGFTHRYDDPARIKEYTWHMVNYQSE